MMDVRLGMPARRPQLLAVGVGPEGLCLDGVPVALLPPSARAALLSWFGTAHAQVNVTDAPAASRPGALAELPLPGELPRRVLVAGIGAGRPGDLRLAGAAIARSAAGAGVTVAIPTAAARLSALAEGLVLGAYRFSVGGRRPTRAGTAHLLVAADPGGARRGSRPGEQAGEAALARGLALARATVWARDLTNTPAATKTPAWLAAQADAELGRVGVRVQVRDETWLAANRFGGVLAVGGGSAVPPRLVHASWTGPGAGAAPHLVVVGKGITFDTGGLNIKPGAGMRMMHTDMAGGAAVLAALWAIATLRAPVRVSALVPIAQNSVSGSAMRPSDVIRHFGGRTSEVFNTDAEGRLVLADALAYAAARLRPSVLVDIATLTGAMKVALGLRIGGLIADSDPLADALIEAGQRAGEPLWRLPLIEEYAHLLSSSVADVHNAPGNPGAITAALFLRPFAGAVPWAHLDIAGPARAERDDGLLSAGATGFGARLLAEWILGQSSDA
ncbi:MAG TPA: leucyl aminopeptidase family protein [Jatrophihabitantaceae bacterium]|jgi:leucyl aminopeptidase|nr:leucyl aminopeptidase family protein [Jatrophihabitantaceae bacterium]